MEYPDAIYHYTHVEKLFLILGDFQLKMNALKNVNDPREWMEYEPVVDKRAKSAYKALRFIQSRNINTNTIVCFSGDSKKVKGYDLPTMWAHYGDNFKGVSLQINPFAFIEENNKRLLNKYLFFDKVHYEKPIANITVEGEMPLEKLRQIMFFSKRPDWESEQEWRLLSIHGRQISNIRKSLEAIILGLDFNYSFLPSIRKLIEGEEILIKQLKLDNKSQSFYVETI